MGRPPCCDKAGIKKGPWTPEEDIILVSYIQEHGPGNWRSVPTNTGLARCSKSCRLRWTNYLRPGIKRGNFTPHEEGMIIHLQALLGNKWAAIASYLPQRTDNDIKNYWNTHLKKKLKKFQAALEPHHLVSSPSESTISSQFMSKSFHERTSLNMNGNHTSSLRLSQSSSSSTYASSTENISRLLQGWMAASPKPDTSLLTGTNKDTELPNNDDNNISNLENNKGVVKSASCGDMVSHEEFDSMLSFENLNSAAWDRSTGDSMAEQSSEVSADQKVFQDVAERNKPRSDHNNSAPPLSFLEKWLFEENVGHDEMMELSPMF